MWIYKLQTEHYPVLYKVARETESAFMSQRTIEQFTAQMRSREGYVIVNRAGAIVGCISFSDFVAGMDILIHCSVLDKYQRRWCTKSILTAVFKYVFETLSLPRLSGICIPGMSDTAGEFLLRMGFKFEGLKRQCVKLPDGMYDLKMFGMLKEECRWIT